MFQKGGTYCIFVSIYGGHPTCLHQFMVCGKGVVPEEDECKRGNPVFECLRSCKARASMANAAISFLSNVLIFMTLQE